MDFVNGWSAKTGITLACFILWLGIASSKFYAWRKHYGRANEHNGWIPRDYWLAPREREAIVSYFHRHPDDGYRRLTFMMLDENVVAVSPTTVWRVLNGAGLLRRWNEKTNKGQGFQQPLQPHEHWHVDVSYLNISGTFYYLCSALDGCSRFIVYWDIRESMTEGDIELVLQKAKELHPGATPRIITDNGPQFIAKDFKEFIRISGMTHVKTSPYYPQSNGKIERFHKTIKQECIRPKIPLTLEDAQRLAAGYIEHYNTKRLHSAIGYVTPRDKLEGRERSIFAERDRKLEAARAQRAAARKEGHAILAAAG